MVRVMTTPTPAPVPPQSQPRTGKRVHVAVYLDEATTELLDRYASDNARSRSSAGAYLLTAALRMFVERG